MKGRKLFTLFAVLSFVLFGAASLRANSVTPEQAKQLAAQFLTDKAQNNASGTAIRRSVPSQNELETKVVFDAKDKQGQPLLYAVNFKTQGGFVLVSGDDNFERVLGYSDNGVFDEQNMPENARAWLQGYIDEMKYLTSIGYKSSKTRSAVSKVAIEPLVQTQWNQGDPFNLLCPTDTWTGNTSVTGCVATAMAQVINYHIQHDNGPAALVTDIPSYTTSSHSLSVSGFAAGSPIPNKDLLLNIYDDGASDAQREAVAQLMVYCGVSVRMDYTSGGSGAFSGDVPIALINYFGFDPTARQILRENYSYNEWMNAIYAELAAGRPVYYSGSSSGGGHAFVADGYDGDGLFHINWGWGGSSDGYFMLSVLNPGDNSQIGASTTSDGYSYNQGAVIKVQMGSGEPAPATVISLTFGSYQTAVYDGDAYAMFSAFNTTGGTYTFEVGTGFLDDEGEITPINYSETAELGSGWGYSTWSSYIPNDITCANTTKKIVPISREKGTTTWYSSANPARNYFLAEYDENGVPHLSVHPIFDLQATSMAVHSSKYVNEEQTVTVTLDNKGDEYYGALYLFASKDESNKGDYVSRLGLTIMKGVTQDVGINWTPEETGTYYLWVARDWQGENVMISSSVTIGTDPATAGKILMVSALHYDGQDDKSWQVDEVTGNRTVNIYWTNLSGWISITNLTDQDQTLDFKILVDTYNSSTGQFDNENRSGYYNDLTFGAGGTEGFWCNRYDFTPDNLYRIRLSRVDVNPAEDLDAHVYIRLLKPRATILTRPHAVEDLVYNGAPQTLITAGTADGGTMEYSLDNSVWSTELPAATEAGDYTVYYRVVGDADHSDHPGASLVVTIAPNDPSGIDQVNMDNQPTTHKIIRDGSVLILRGDKIYTITGQQVR